MQKQYPKQFCSHQIHRLTIMRVLYIVFILLIPITVHAQDEPVAERPEANLADVGTVDAIINAVYETLSGPIGQERPWDRNRSLFHPTARLIHTQWEEGGEAAIIFPMSHEEHIEAVSGYTVERGFYEKEIGREVISYGTVTHVFSTYEYHSEDGVMSGRGINSFQLFYDGSRYWITSVIWSQEAPEHPIPERFITQ